MWFVAKDRPKHLVKLLKNEEVHRFNKEYKEWQKENPDKQLNLSGMDFSDLNLNHVDLSGANLQRTDFSNALLYNAIFSNTISTGVNFVCADLSYAKFTGAVCPHAKFQDTNCRHTKFLHSKLQETDFSGSTSFESTHFSGADLTGAQFFEILETNLSHMITDRNTILSDTVYSIRSAYYYAGINRNNPRNLEEWLNRKKGKNTQKNEKKDTAEIITFPEKPTQKIQEGRLEKTKGRYKNNVRVGPWPSSTRS